MNPFSIFEKVLSRIERKTMKHVGYNRLVNYKPKFTSLERKYYLMLKELNIYYIPQYPLDGRYYDAYLPDQNILLEFDGTFWHPKSEKEAIYESQKKALKTDKIKNKIAKENGMKIIRIREEEPVTPDQLKKLILS